MPLQAPTPESRADAEQHWQALVHRIDQHAQAGLARAMAGLSPAQAMLVWLDWLTHFAQAPGKQIDVARRNAEDAQTTCSQWLRPAADAPTATDSRFKAADWQIGRAHV